MSSSRLPLSARPAFLPDEISRREFATVFRGYDPAEVRTFLNQLAEQAAETADRVAEIQKTLAATERQVKNPELDEETVTRLLGEQTAQILRSAREAGNEMRARAEEEVSRSLRDAHEVTSRMRQEAETLLSERTDEAERMAETVRAEAAEAADATRRRASEDASQIRSEAAEAADRLRREADEDALKQRQDAQQESRDLVATARHESQALVERTREQQAELLEGIVRKRKIALAQVEQLRAGRQRLLQAYMLVRSGLDEVTAELERVEAEARRSAESAGVAAAQTAGLETGELEEVIELDAIELADDVPTEMIDLIEADLTTEQAAEQPTTMTTYDIDGAHQSADVGDQGGSATATLTVTPTKTLEPGTLDDQTEIIDVAVLREATGELFDAERQNTPSQSSAMIIGEAYSAPRSPEADAEVNSRREAVITKNRSQALRRLRRALQEEQDVVLARLRSGEGSSLQALLGSVDDQAVSYQRAVEKLFRDVARSGAAAVKGSADLDNGVLDNTSGNAASSLATELVEDLRSQLAPVVEELLAADTMPDNSTLQTLIHASYSGVKGDYLSELVNERMGGVFDQGVALAQRA